MIEDMDTKIEEILADLQEISAPLPALEWDIKTICLGIGDSLKNPKSYRAGAAVWDTITLAYEHAVMAHLAELLRCEAAGVAVLAQPGVAMLRDICVAAGVRRGVILSAGDDTEAISLAVELMDEFITSYTPHWAADL